MVASSIEENADSIESIRAKSKNLKGDLSHTIKLNVQRIKCAAADLATRCELTGDVSYLHMRETELLKENKELKTENISLRDQIDALRRELRQFKQDVHDGKIGIGLKSPKRIVPTRDIATSPLESLRYSSLSLPAGSKSFVGSQANNIRGPSILPGRRSLARIEESGRNVSDVSRLAQINRRSSKGRLTSEDDRGIQEDRGSRVPQSRRRRRRRRSTTEEEIRGSDAPVTQSDTEWSVVESRRRRRERSRRDRREDADSPMLKRQSKVQGNLKLPRIRPPRSAAVAIRVTDGKTSYADIMRKARREVNLEQLNLGDTRIRKDVSGRLLVQIPGKGSKEKARQLQDKLQLALGQEARVTIPSKRAEIRIVGFDDSVTEDEVVERITTDGGCNRSDIKTGPIRSMANGLYAVWLQCPVDVVQNLVKIGRVRLGWTSARVVLLPPRRLQCFRCLEFGHVRSMCPSDTDRSNLCYRCGEAGHKASACSGRIRCPVCLSRGLVADHRVGTDKCAARRISGIRTRPRNASDELGPANIGDKSARESAGGGLVGGDNLMQLC
ncbi:uncharacterized protein LOC109862278 [Pseudomyrmex gracilis]|uniref:uncharacterized protein LOC109862278 n=1 Tax=Pseudomyrmex gracilis TaxID=219809 RepID=UPI0009953385|nr:uncharacterized protein LOC109862278 [Pseudomyrmex gracilis]